MVNNKKDLKAGWTGRGYQENRLQSAVICLQVSSSTLNRSQISKNSQQLKPGSYPKHQDKTGKREG